MSTLNHHQRVRAVTSTVTGTLLFLIGVLVGVLALAAYVNMHSPGTLPYSNVSADQREPYGGCDEAYLYPGTEGAEWCATHRPAPERIPACLTDEGDQPGPCVWDARHMGNGEGHSFFISKRDRYWRIAHARAHCMVRWHQPGTCAPVNVPDDGGLFD